VHGGSLQGGVSAFTVSGNGTLTSVGTSPYPDLQTAPCWVALAPDGQHLFAANTGSDSISGYSIAAGGALTLVGSTALNGGPGIGTFDLGLDPAGRFLYEVDGNKHEVSVLAVKGRTLDELASSPVSLGLPANAAPSGIAIS